VFCNADICDGLNVFLKSPMFKSKWMLQGERGIYM